MIERNTERPWAKFTTLGAGGLTALIGGAHLAAWLGGVMAQRGVSNVTMKTNAALCLLLLGLGMVLLAGTRAGGTRRWVGRACAALAMVIGALTLSEYLFGWDLGIDQLLATEPTGALGAVSPNRMGLPATICFLLVGSALLILGRARGRGVRAAQGLALGVCLIALLGNIGHLYGVQGLFNNVARVTTIAWPTALALLLLGVGLLFARAREGFMAPVTADDSGGAILRRLLLPGLLLPVVVGWLRLTGERLGLFDAALGTALVMITFITVLSTLAWLAGRWVSRSAAKIVRQKELLAVTLTSIGDGVITCDTAGRVTFLNPVAEGLSGWENAAAIGHPIQDIFKIINEETRQPAEDIVGRVLREKRIAELANHSVLVARDGREVPIEDSAAPILNGSGEIAGVVLVFHDVTERRRAQEALRLSEEKFAKAFAGNPAAMTLTRLEDGLFLEVNDTWLALNGYSRDEVIGQFATQKHIWPTTEASTRFVQELREKNSLHGWEQEFFKKSGEVFVVQLSAQILTVRGEPLILATLVDITERKQAENALRQANERLAEADRRKDEFLAMLAHELRNPLAPIRNAVQIVKLAGANETVREKNFAIIERQASHMGRLLDDLLDVSRMTRGKIALKLETLDLCMIAYQAVEAASHAAQAQCLEIHYANPPEPVLLEGDITRLEQVVGNLINNAIKYSDAGQIQVMVGRQSAYDGKGPWAVVRVRDTGIGIAPEMLPRVFELFAQASQSLDRTRGGLGIGLTMVKRLVDLHGGRVEARSAGLGQGSEFFVFLPLLENRRIEETPGVQEPALNDPEEVLLKILVVDDEQDSAGSLKELLEMWGYEVQTAFDGLTAIRRALTFLPDVILLDIGLPGMSGHAVAQKLREARALESVKIIALTGYGQEEDRKMTSESGFDAHLVKPVDLHHLQIMLARIVVGT